MPGTRTVSQQTDHELNPVKAWPNPYALDKSVPVDTAEDLIAGMVFHIDPTTKKAKPGITGTDMALFAFPNQEDFDVTMDVGNILGEEILGLVATGGWELESTEFVAGDYAPNDVLTSAAAGGDKGKLVEGTAYTDPICGVVSDGQLQNENSKDVLRFWSVWLPPTP